MSERVELPASVRVHATALCESEHIGNGTSIWAFAHVQDGAVVGRDCNIGDHAFVESGAKVGAGVTIKNHVMVWDGVTIGDGVFIGPGATFTNDRYPRSRRGGEPAVVARYASKENWLACTRVGDGASIGARAVIGPGVSLGRYCMVAAGAVVTKDIPNHALVGGLPARIMGWVCRCGKPLSVGDQAVRCDCSDVYDFDVSNSLLVLR